MLIRRAPRPRLRNAFTPPRGGPFLGTFPSPSEKTKSSCVRGRPPARAAALGPNRARGEASPPPHELSSSGGLVIAAGCQCGRRGARPADSEECSIAAEGQESAIDRSAHPGDMSADDIQSLLAQVRRSHARSIGRPYCLISKTAAAHRASAPGVRPS